MTAYKDPSLSFSVTVRGAAFTSSNEDGNEGDHPRSANRAWSSVHEITWTCVLEERRRCHPRDGGTNPASVSSGQGNVLLGGGGDKSN